MLSEKRRYHHAHAVMHKASGPELPHASIHDRVARLSTLPCCEALLISTPGEVGELRVKRLIRHGGKVEEQVIAEFSPADFAEKLIGCAARLGLKDLARLRSVPDLSRGEIAEAKVG